MWLLLSSRLRTWLAVAILVPLLRAVLRRIAARNPNSPMATRLRQADSALGQFGKRGQSGRRSRRRR